MHATIDDLLQNSNLTLHLIKENTVLHKDSRSNEKFIFGIKALMSKNYSDNLSEEVKKGLLEKAEQGTYPSNNVPMGYRTHREGKKSSVIVEPTEAEQVQYIYKLYSTGSYSLRGLRKKLIDEGFVYKGGKKLHTSTLFTILNNIFYTGSFIWKDILYENASHKTLISKELYQQVQRIMNNPYKSKSRKGLFPFTNLITCGLCGYKFTAELKKEKYIYYHCARTKGKCDSDYIRQEKIDDLFEQLFNKIAITNETKSLILQSLKESLKDKIEHHNKLIDQLHIQTKRLQHRIDQAYMDKLDGKVEEEFWKTKNQERQHEKANLHTKLHTLQNADTQYIQNADLILELSKNASHMFKTGSI